MKRSIFNYFAGCALAGMMACTQSPTPKEEVKGEASKDEFKYQVEQFADLKLLRYDIPGFDQLTLKQKKLLYHLYEAAYSGRDITWDQKYKYNLAIRRTLEEIIQKFDGDKTTDDYKKFVEYTKRVWFSNGIHHHYSTNKILPEFTQEYFKTLVDNTKDAQWPVKEGQTAEGYFAEITPVIFDPKIDPKGVNLAANIDIIKNSATNYYSGVTQKEVEDYYKSVIKSDDPTPISYGLNSQLAKVDGKVVERTWKVGGMYSSAIEKIVEHLSEAQKLAESETQAKALGKLIEYYKTGDLKTFDEYSILWVQDTIPVVDVVNGFIEVYGDPLGYRGSWQSVVSVKDLETTKTFGQIAGQALYFEKNSPTMAEHKKEEVTAVSYKVINVVAESGDCSPSTPIGVNLPNANWIRATYGSKSVSLGNIEHAYDEGSKGSGLLQEFYTPEQAEMIRQYGTLSGKLHTGLHEVIGHGSGKIEEGVGTPKETLKNYASTLEEARADLVALYFMFDNKLVEINLTPSTDVGKAAYDSYIVNGLMLQLARINPGENIEEAHMRNRQLIAKWVYEKGKKDNVIEKKSVDGKTYYVINDYQKLQILFGELLKEIQRIKSQGDFEAGKALVENYGVLVDATIHGEVLERYASLKKAPYTGFMNPYLKPVMKDGEIVDIKVEYPDTFENQMLFYAKNYSFLPSYN
ncbi:MAG: hypothetical protein ACEPOV_05655 [Hyphomicrobiales bacterium]